MKITEEKLDELLQDMHIEEICDEFNSEMSPEDAIDSTYYYILENLPEEITDETEIESEYYDTVKEYIMEWYETSICFNSWRVIGSY